jgi:hypothetical protein
VSETISESERKLVDDVRDKLMEQFDSVRIFVTRHNGGAEETACYETGGGNFYAQLGQVQEWVCIQDQYQRNHAIRKDEEDS